MKDKPAVPTTTRNAQVIVAVIGLLGVLGAALLSNWDSIFPRNTSSTSTSPVSVPTQNTAPEQTTAPAANTLATTSGTQSPVVTGNTGNVMINIDSPRAAKPSSGAKPAADRSKLLGTWLTPFVASAYGKPSFSVHLTFEVFGGEMIGTVTIAGQEAGRGQTQPLDMLDLAIDGETVSFKTRFFGALCEFEKYGGECVGGPPAPSEF